MSRKPKYKINCVSWIGGKQPEGASMWYFFKEGHDAETGKLVSADKLRWTDRNIANVSAARLYKGNDVDGVGVRWDIVKDL